MKRVKAEIFAFLGCYTVWTFGDNLTCPIFLIFPETSVITINLCGVTFRKSEDLIYMTAKASNR